MVYILITICLVGAIIFLFDIFNIAHEKPDNSKSLMNWLEDAGPTPLTKTVARYKGKKEFFVVQEVMKAKNILNTTKRADEYQSTIIKCLIFSFIGITIALIIDNIILIPVLALLGFMIPLWSVNLYQNKYKKYMNMQLESCVSLITTSYIRNDNILVAIEENIDNISDLIKPEFEEFLAEYKVDPNMRTCIRSLQSKINDNIFREWCDAVIKAYENSEMKENLLAIVEKYSSVRIVQDELDAETANSLIEYIGMIAALILVYPMVRVLNVEWFNMYWTAAGKVCVGISAVVGIYSVKKLMDLTTPVQFER